MQTIHFVIRYRTNTRWGMEGARHGKNIHQSVMLCQEVGYNRSTFYNHVVHISDQLKDENAVGF